MSFLVNILNLIYWNIDDVWIMKWKAYWVVLLLELYSGEYDSPWFLWKFFTFAPQIIPLPWWVKEANCFSPFILLNLGCTRIQGNSRGRDKLCGSVQLSDWNVTYDHDGLWRAPFQLTWLLRTRAAPCLLFPVMCLEKSMKYDCSKEW